jgi:integral membrane sensor domain MASE1
VKRPALADQPASGALEKDHGSTQVVTGSKRNKILPHQGIPARQGASLRRRIRSLRWTSHDRLQPHLRLGLQILALAAAWYLTARLGLLAGTISGNVSPFWPATGVGLVALLVFGGRVWPGITLAAIPIELTLLPAAPALVSTVGDTLAPICGYLLLRLAGFRLELDRLKDALTLVFLGAFAGMLTNASLGTVIRLVAGEISASGFWSAWLVWWTGDVMGVLVVVPLLLTLRTLHLPRNVNWSRWAEYTVLLAASFVVAVLGVRYDTLYLAFPIIVWAALRFQLAGAAPCALIVSVGTIDAAIRGYGPFAGQDLLMRMPSLQIYNGALVLTALLLAVIIRDRDRSRFEVDHTITRLSEVINHIDGADRPTLKQLAIDHDLDRD